MGRAYQGRTGEAPSCIHPTPLLRCAVPLGHSPSRGPPPGQVLDMCAAPGSKTFQLLEALHSGSHTVRARGCGRWVGGRWVGGRWVRARCKQAIRQRAPGAWGRGGVGEWLQGDEEGLAGRGPPRPAAQWWEGTESRGCPHDGQGGRTTTCCVPAGLQSKLVPAAGMPPKQPLQRRLAAGASAG